MKFPCGYLLFSEYTYIYHGQARVSVKMYVFSFVTTTRKPADTMQFRFLRVSNEVLSALNFTSGQAKGIA